MADRAGVRFTRAATGSEAAALAMQARLQKGYVVDDFFPPASNFPERLAAITASARNAIVKPSGKAIRG